MSGSGSIATSCSNCKTIYKVSDSLIGKYVTCKRCKTKFEIIKSNQNRQYDPTLYPAICNLAVKYQFITPKQLQDAAVVQKALSGTGNPPPLEGLLLTKGMITTEQLEKLQATMKYSEERQLDKKFGDIAIEYGVITKEVFEKALQAQVIAFKEEQICQLLGDILVESGAMTEKQRDAILIEQKRLQDEKEAMIDDIEDDDADVPLAELDLTVSEDKMKAFIQLKKGSEGRITLKQITGLLEENNITHGMVAYDAIRSYMNNHDAHGSPFKIAEGSSPFQGRSAEIKYHFETEYIKSGTVTEDGQIDFKDRGEVPHVNEGDLLAEKTPRVKSESGTDVHGNPAPVKEAKDIKLKGGPGTTVSEDGLKIFSKATGQPKLLFDGKITVMSELKIKGDIGLETGHVEFEGNITVTETIQSGFKVKGGNLQAKEILSSEINTSGDIKVIGGIIGSTIKARGNVTAKYIKGATIQAYGDVTVAKEIIDANIISGGTCSVKTGKLISSEIIAKKGIFVKDIGTEMSNACKLTVGIDIIAELKIKSTEEKIAEKFELIAGLTEKKDAFSLELEETHKKIAALAQIQDKAMQSQRKLNEIIKTLKESGDEEALTKNHSLLEDLEKKVKAADEETNTMFNRQDELNDENDSILAEINAIHEIIHDLNDEKEAIVAWSKQEKAVALVDVGGIVYVGTKIIGPNARTTLPDTVKHSQFREVHNVDSESNREYEIKVFPK
ncbi:MAG: FapA family protein [Desulfobacterales bacterium]|nr:FapA family protein [Desulfobacterales bacterium]